MDIDVPDRRLLLRFFIALAIFVPNITFANTSVETAVRNYFKDTPVMIEIAKCESEFKQFGTDGMALRGGWLNGMVGVFQLFESVHLGTAKTLGLDLNTLEGNLAYAKYLYDTSGTKPWNSSKACWGKAALSLPALPKAEAAAPNLSNEKKRAELIKQIMVLLKLLEKKQKMALNN